LHLRDSGFLPCSATNVWPALFSAIVLVEMSVIVFSHGHCPLTPIAVRCTDDRRANFDICLPQLLADKSRVREPLTNSRENFFLTRFIHFFSDGAEPHLPVIAASQLSPYTAGTSKLGAWSSSLKPMQRPTDLD
jgi:hypothetical protein